MKLPHHGATLLRTSGWVSIRYRRREAAGEVGKHYPRRHVPARLLALGLLQRLAGSGAWRHRIGGDGRKELQRSALARTESRPLVFGLSAAAALVGSPSWDHSSELLEA